MIEFNKAEFKKLVKNKFVTYENFRDTLHYSYGLDKKLNTVQKWGQISHSSVPQSKDMPHIASALGIEVMDLYTDAKKIRAKITNEELLSNQSKYSESLSKVAMSTYPKEMQQFINNFQLLNEEEKQHFYDEVAKIAQEKLTL